MHTENINSENLPVTKIEINLKNPLVLQEIKGDQRILHKKKMNTFYI